MRIVKLEENKRYIRCFLGIPLPEQFKEEFGKLFSDLNQIDPSLRPVDIHTPHVLLHFLGNQRGVDLLRFAGEVAGSVKGLFGIKLMISEMGLFKNRRMKVIFLKVSGPPVFLEVASTIKEKLSQFYLEEKGFRPHLTLARKEGIGPINPSISERINKVNFDFPIKEVCFYGAEAVEIGMHQEKLICFKYDY